MFSQAWTGEMLLVYDFMICSLIPHLIAFSTVFTISPSTSLSALLVPFTDVRLKNAREKTDAQRSRS